MIIVFTAVGIILGFSFGYFVGELQGRTKEFKLWQSLAEKGHLVMQDQQKLIDRQQRLMSVQQRLFEVAPIKKSPTTQNQGAPNIIPFKIPTPKPYETV